MATSVDKLADLLPDLLASLNNDLPAAAPELAIAWAAIGPVAELKARAWLDTADPADVDAKILTGLAMAAQVLSDDAPGVLLIPGRALVVIDTDTASQLVAQVQGVELAAPDDLGNLLER